LDSADHGIPVLDLVHEGALELGELHGLGNHNVIIHESVSIIPSSNQEGAGGLEFFKNKSNLLPLSLHFSERSFNVIFFLGYVTFLLNSFSKIDHALVDAPLEVESIERLDIEANSSGNLGPMTGLDTISTHSHSHTNVLSEV
jgi:hypothetical protein